MNGDSTRGGREPAIVRSGAIDMTGTSNGAATGLAAAAVAAAVGPAGGVAEVSGAVAQWVEQVGRFLGVLQTALEQSLPRDDASPEVRALSNQLPALIRQCRAQVPTPEMIQTWVKTLSENQEPAPDAARGAQPLVTAGCQA